VTFVEAGIYPVNQSNLKSIQKAMIVGKMPALQKATFILIM